MVSGLGRCCCGDRCDNGLPYSIGPESGVLVGPFIGGGAPGNRVDYIGPMQRRYTDQPLIVEVTMDDWQPAEWNVFGSVHRFVLFEMYVNFASPLPTTINQQALRLFRAYFRSSPFPLFGTTYSQFIIITGGDATGAGGTSVYTENFGTTLTDFDASGVYRAEITSAPPNAGNASATYTLTTPFATITTTQAGYTGGNGAINNHCYVWSRVETDANPNPVFTLNQVDYSNHIITS